MLTIPLVHPLPAVDCLPGVCHPHWQHQGGAAPGTQHPPGLSGQGHSWYSAAGLTLEGNVSFDLGHQNVRTHASNDIPRIVNEYGILV